MKTVLVLLVAALLFIIVSQRVFFMKIFEPDAEGVLAQELCGLVYADGSGGTLLDLQDGRGTLTLVAQNGGAQKALSVIAHDGEGCVSADSPEERVFISSANNVRRTRSSLLISTR